MLVPISSSLLTADIGSTIVLLLGIPSVTAIVATIGNILKERTLLRSQSKPQKVEIRSSSGDAIVVEIGTNMGKEETARLVERLQNFGRQASNTEDKPKEL